MQSGIIYSPQNQLVMYTICHLNGYRLYDWYFTTKEGAEKFGTENNLGKAGKDYYIQSFRLNDAY